jgi:flagellar hook assembly protein FlgD
VLKGDVVEPMPAVFAVNEVTPNPFKTNTVICYGLPARTRVTIKVYDVLGKIMTVLQDGIQFPGWHTVTWNGGDEENLRSPAGIYFCEIQTENSSIVRKLILLK